MLSMKKFPQFNRGFSMIEILIALFVLAIGVLGFAGLQLMALSSSEEGNLRGQATQLAEDLAARMRSNTLFINSAAEANEYLANSKGAAVAGYTRYCAIGADAVSADDPPTVCTDEFCTSADLAAFDRTQVCNSLSATGLPDGEIGIRCSDRDDSDADDCSSYSRYTIYVGWQPHIKADKGEVAQAVSGPCANEMGLTGTKSCVALELFP